MKIPIVAWYKENKFYRIRWLYQCFIISQTRDQLNIKLEKAAAKTIKGYSKKKQDLAVFGFAPLGAD
jgi:hypothetical protein